MTSPLIRAEQSALLLVDLQERLLPQSHDWQRVIGHADWLVHVAGTAVFRDISKNFLR